MSIRRVALSLLIAATACSESKGEDPVDAGPIDAGGVPDGCTDEAACILTPMMRASDYIYPVGDRDRWAFDIDAGKVVNIIVENDIEFSPIRLEVVLFGPDGNGGLAAIENVRFMGNGRQRVVLQRVIQRTGQHQLEVRDVGADGQDRAPYFVELTILDETDNNEPNDTSDMPTLLTAGTPVSGTIGSQGDVDWFAIDVSTNELVQIEMVAAGVAPVRFVWTLFDPAGMVPIAESREPTGDVAWPLENRAVGNAMGRYLIRVQDDPNDGQQADLERIYVLTARVLQEPDANERVSQNDTANRPTRINAGDSVTGFIASVSDVDFYSFMVTGAPQLITVSAMMPAGTAVDLSFSLYGTDGNRLICEAELGDECRSIRFVRDGAPAPASLTTSHVAMQDGLYFLAVQDLQDNDYDDATAYTFTVQTPAEPDVGENYGAGRMSARRVVPTSTAGTTIMYPWAEGYLSYAGDEDWFRLDLPGPIGAPGQNGDWELQFELQMVSTPIELEAFFFGEEGSPRENYRGFGKQCRNDGEITPADPEPCQFPEADNAIDLTTGGPSSMDCFVVFRPVTEAGPHYFRMSDLQRNDYDLGASGRYRFRVTAYAGCQVPGACEGIFTDGQGDLCGRP